MDPVSWRDGVHLSGTPIWCDARRTRDVCFVSHASALAAARHGQLVTTAETVALLARERDVPAADTLLPIPYGRPFTLGTVRLELYPSGHAVGGASLVAQVNGQRIAYAGRVNPAGGGLAGAAELRPCDTLVVSARYGSPEYAFPPVDTVATAVDAACADITAAGGAAVVLVSSVEKALDVAHRLAPERAVSAHRGIHRAARLLHRAGFQTPVPRRLTGAPRGGEVVLWPLRHRDRLDDVAVPAGSRVLLVSGACADPTARQRARADVGFLWSNEADCAALVSYIEATQASKIYLLDRFGPSLADSLRSTARKIQALGPPTQMRLF